VKTNLELEQEIANLKEQLKILNTAVKRCGNKCVWGQLQIQRLDKEKKENG
jgi:hypothetical protein